MSHLSLVQSGPFFIHDRVCNKSNTTGVTCGVRVARSLVDCVMFCRSLFVLFLLAIVLSVLLRFTPFDYPFGILDLHRLITPLVS